MNFFRIACTSVAAYYRGGPVFGSTSVHVGFMVDEVSMGHIFLHVI